MFVERKVALWKCLVVKSIEEHSQLLDPFSSTCRHAKPRSPNVEFTLEVAPLDFCRFKPDRADVSELRGKIVTYLRSSYSVDQLARIRESMVRRLCAPMVGGTYNARYLPTPVGRRGDPSSHQPRVSSSILLTATINVP